MGGLPTETPLDIDLLDRDPLDRDLPPSPWKEHGTRDRDSPEGTWGQAATQEVTPRPNRMTQASENITLPQLHLRAVIITDYYTGTLSIFYLRRYFIEN